MSRTCSALKSGFGSGSFTPLNKKTRSSASTLTGINKSPLSFRVPFSSALVSQEAGLAGVAGPDAGFSILSPPSLSVDLLGGTHHSGSNSSDPGFLLFLLSAEVDG